MKTFRLHEDIERQRCKVFAKHVFLFNKLSLNAFGDGATPFEELDKSSFHALDFMEILIAEAEGVREQALIDAYLCVLNGIDKATGNAMKMCMIAQEADGSV
jgi:hypothetical protein